MTMPTVTVIERYEWTSDGKPYVNTRYRIEGGETGNGWKARPGEVAWCEISMGADEDERVGGYGGEVWPTAWPALFAVPAGLTNLRSGRVSATIEGMRLLSAARAAYAATR